MSEIKLSGGGEAKVVMALVKSGFKWVQKKWAGSIEITEPRNRDLIKEQPWLNVKGISTKPKNKIYWLLTRKEKLYWPKIRISVASDGRWQHRVYVAKRAYTEDHTLVLAEVNAFADSVFEYWRTNGTALDWKPLILHEDAHTFKIVQSLIIPISGTDQGGKLNA